MSRKIKIPAFLGVLVAILWVGAVLIYPGDKIAKGVTSFGTDLGGLTLSQAESLINKSPQKPVEKIYIYTKGGAGIEILGEEISAGYDAKNTALAAFSVGRSKNALKNIYDLILARFVPNDVGYICTFDREKLAEILYNFGVSLYGESNRFILNFGEETVTVKQGKSGQSKDVSNALYTFGDALRYRNCRIFVELEREPLCMPNLRNLYDETYIAPTDATYELSGGRLILTPEKLGRQIDMQDAANKMGALRRGEAVEVNLVTLSPQVTLEMLNQKLFNHILAEYTTSYSQGDKGRSANVTLAARKINGVVLAPGEVFSFNQTVGPRTTAAGFMSAPVFENGETVQGTGGGVCQVSSTLYSAVLYADLEIVSRKNHSLTVAYVPKGQDATVSYGTIDFKFKNSTGYPIKILASASGGKMKVSICGTAPDVEKNVKIMHNIVSENPPTVEEIGDESMLYGTRKTISSGKTGYTVVSSRIVTAGGQEIKNERLGSSVYKSVPAKVLVGTKVQQAEVTPTPDSTPEATLLPDTEVSEDITPETEQVFLETEEPEHTEEMTE